MMSHDDPLQNASQPGRLSHTVAGWVAGAADGMHTATEASLTAEQGRP